MNRSFDSAPEWERPREADVNRSSEHAFLWALSRPAASPDLTRPIMGRLGYMKAAPGVVRRRRIRRWVNRLTLAAVGLLVVVVAARMHESGPHARRAAGPTIPAAIGSDVNRHQQRIRGTIQLIREFAPAAPTDSPPPDDALDEDVDRSAVGPFRWV